MQRIAASPFSAESHIHNSGRRARLSVFHHRPFTPAETRQIEFAFRATAWSLDFRQTVGDTGVEAAKLSPCGQPFVTSRRSGHDYLGNPFTVVIDVFGQKMAENDLFLMCQAAALVLSTIMNADPVLAFWDSKSDVLGDMPCHAAQNPAVIAQ